MVNVDGCDYFAYQVYACPADLAAEEMTIVDGRVGRDASARDGVAPGGRVDAGGQGAAAQGTERDAEPKQRRSAVQAVSLDGWAMGEAAWGAMLELSDDGAFGCGWG